MDITGDEQGNVLNGTAGDDTIDGLGGDDTIDGLAGNDAIDGGNGNDTLIYSGGSDILKGGAGNDRVVIDAFPSASTSFDGGSGTDTLIFRNLLVPPQNLTSYQFPSGLPTRGNALVNVTLTSFERLEFVSSAGTTVSGMLRFSYPLSGGGYDSQIGSGLSTTAELVGGQGQDFLTLQALVSQPSGVVTLNAPTFTYTGWQTVDRAYQAGDRVNIVQSGNADSVINGSSHVGIQGLFGGNGNDTINGSGGMDFIAGGNANTGNIHFTGLDQLHGGGGNDTLALVNMVVPLFGSPGNFVITQYTGAGTLFDGGDGFDFLMLGGEVDFQGTVQDIEGVYLAPGFTNSGLSGSQQATRVMLAGDALAQFPDDLEIDGMGTLMLDLTYEDDDENVFGSDFDGSRLTFTSGAQITFEITDADTDDEIIGTAMRDVVVAGGGSDRITGGGGDDEINGALGSDVAYFADAFADCTVTYDGLVTIVATKTQGTDRLRNVEKLNFAGVDSTLVLPNDSVAPTATFTDPAPGTATGMFTYGLTFSEDVTDLFFGNFIVTNGLVWAVTGSGKNWSVQVRPTDNFEGNVELSLRAGGVFDAAGNPNAAATAPVKAIDTKLPALVSATPASGLETTVLDGNIVLQFSEPVVRGAGTLVLSFNRFDGNPNTIFETFDMATSPRVSISGSTVTIDPINEFHREDRDTYYYFDMPIGGLRDAAGNPSPLITGNMYGFRLPAVASSILFAEPGFEASLGGKVKIFGTQGGLQDITLLDRPGTVTFDGSFNSGGDIVRLSKIPGAYAIAMSGSSARLFDANGFEMFVPLGKAGTFVEFADGVRKLGYDASTGQPELGALTIPADPINAATPTDGTTLPTGTDTDAVGRLFLAENADLVMSGNISIFGSKHAERIELHDGVYRLDGSFNRGGDVIELDAAASAYTARSSGSSVILTGAGIDLTIPTGEVGLTIDFAGNERLLRFVGDDIRIGDQVITSGGITLG